MLLYHTYNHKTILHHKTKKEIVSDVTIWGGGSPSPSGTTPGYTKMQQDSYLFNAMCYVLQ